MIITKEHNEKNQINKNFIRRSYIFHFDSGIDFHKFTISSLSECLTLLSKR